MQMMVVKMKTGRRPNFIALFMVSYAGTGRHHRNLQRDPPDIAEAEQKVVEGTSAVHVRDRDARILGYSGPRSTEGVLAVRKSACIERQQE